MIRALRGYINSFLRTTPCLIALLTSLTLLSCGRAGPVSPPAIISGNAIRDKILLELRVQLNLRTEIPKQVIYEYLKSANDSGNQLTFGEETFFSDKSDDLKHSSQITHGLIKEFGKLGAEYSFENTAPTDQLKKIRASIVRSVFNTLRSYDSLDQKSARQKAEIAYACALGLMSGVSSTGLADNLKKDAIVELFDTLGSITKDAKWADSENEIIALSYVKGGVQGLKTSNLSSSTWTTLMGLITDHVSKKIGEYTISVSDKVSSIVSLQRNLITSLAQLGVSSSAYNDTAAEILNKGVPVLEITGSDFVENLVSLVGGVVTDSLPVYGKKLDAASISEFYKMIAYTVVKAYKTKSLSTDVTQQAEKIKVSMNNAAKSVATQGGVSAEVKQSAESGIADGIQQILTE